MPPPVRDIPILIGGSGTKRTLPAVARYADIWHTFLDVHAYAQATALVDAYLDAGATTFITEIHPTAAGGFDFGVLEEMISWRDSHHG